MSNKNHAVPSNNDSSPEGPQRLPPHRMTPEQRQEHLQRMSGQFLGCQAAVADSTTRPPEAVPGKLVRPTEELPRVPKRVRQKNEFEGSMEKHQQHQQEDSRPQFELRELNPQAEVSHQEFALGADGEQMDNNHEMDRDQHPYPEVENPLLPAADFFQPVVDFATESCKMPRRREQQAAVDELSGFRSQRTIRIQKSEQFSKSRTREEYHSPPPYFSVSERKRLFPTAELFSNRENQVDNGTRVPRRGDLSNELPTSASGRKREASSQLMEIPVVDSPSVPSGAPEDVRMSSIEPPVRIVNELYNCRCEKKCLFQVDGDNLLKSRSPSHFMRLCRLKEVFPQIDVEDLMVLAQKPLPPQLDYLTEICWKSICRCPTFSLWVKELDGWEAQFEERYKKSYESVFGQESSDYWKVFKQLFGTK